MEQVLKRLGTYRIPTYAICALENGDYDGDFTEEDIKNIREFEERISKKCPHGYTIDWQDLDDPYFCSNPEFGLAMDVVDAVIYKIVEYDDSKKSPAPIDGKNVNDEFDWIHDNDYTDLEGNNGKHQQLFWNHGCVCVLDYQEGGHCFFIDVAESPVGGDLEAAVSELERCCMNCCDFSEDLILKWKTQDSLYGHKTISGEFYFIEVED